LGGAAAVGVDTADGVAAAGKGCLGYRGRFLVSVSSSSDSQEGRFVADLFSAGCSFLISTTFGSGLLERMSTLPLSSLLSKLGMSSTSGGCKFNKSKIKNKLLPSI
jgi:hypothetical protein